MSIEIKDRQTGEVLFSLGYCKSLRKWIVHEKKGGLLRNPPMIVGTDELKAWFDRDPAIDAQVLSNLGESLL